MKSACVAALATFVFAGCSAQAKPGETPATEPIDAQEADPGTPRKIDVEQLTLSFYADFNDTFSVSSWGCFTDWIAHTPWRGDFGDAVFADPVKGFPFTVEGGVLVIEARRLEGDRWMSGMLSARDVCNSGWSQLYGYFEMRARLPEPPGFVPAFWLVGVNPSAEYGTAEIDVFEFYSAEPDGFTLSTIKHPGVFDPEKRVVGRRHTVAPGLLTRQFNLYGVEVDPKETTFYFNREEIFRTPTTKEFRQPFFPLVSLAANRSHMTDATPDSVEMHVDYIRAYQRLVE